MLTPMMVQYLVGLCCQRHNPDAIDITLGDMVYDKAAQKFRDVDVTITIREADGSLTAFKAVEVKKESSPLDVITVEQLCLKFMDMPQITHKAIFSTSGYTEAAKLKANYHSVELYTMKPWNHRIEDDFPDFPGVGMPEEFLSRIETCLLSWINYSTYLTVPNGPESFSWDSTTPVFSNLGGLHAHYKNLGDYQKDILRRSTNILCMLEPMIKESQKLINDTQNKIFECVKGPAINHSHTMDVDTDAAYLKFEDGIHQIKSLTITGQLQWRMQRCNPEFYILENVRTREIFAGAGIADYGQNDGRMFAVIFPEKGRELGIHRFCIPEKQKNIIHQLKIKD